LRSENPDFDIVGLAVVAFGGLVVVHGMLVAAIAGRYSRVLSLPSTNRRSLVAHAPLALLAPVGGVVAVIAGLVALPGSASALIDIAGRGP
jgi:hypothetical protein